MRGKSINLWRIALLTVLGAGILVLGWVFADTVFEKAIDTLAGAGCFVLLFARLITLKLPRHEEPGEQTVPVELSNDR